MESVVNFAILEPALATLKNSPDLIGSMALFVAKQGGEAVESTRAFIRMLPYGKPVIEKVTSIVDASTISGFKWSNDASAGLAKILGVKGLNYYDEVLKGYGKEFAEYFSKGVGKGAINPANIEVTKFIEVNNAYKAIGINDVFEEGGQEQLEMLIKNTSHGGTNIGEISVSDATRLTKGNQTYGMEHIRKKHIQGIWDGSGPNPPSTFFKEYNISDEYQIKELINKSIQNPVQIVDKGGSRFEYWYYPVQGKAPMITIVDNSGQFFKGRIVTSYPNQ